MIKTTSLVLLALLLPALATAQDHGIFVDGAGLFGVRITPSAEGDPTLFTGLGSATYEWNDANGDRRWQPGEEGLLLQSGLLRQTSAGRVQPGASAAIGTFVLPAISVRLEAARQADAVTTIESNSTLQSVEGQQSSASTDFTVAAAFHQKESRRATVAYLAGIVFRRERLETVLTTGYSLRNTVSNGGFGFTSLPFSDSFEQKFTSTSYTTGVMVGIDVALRMTSHFAVVPQVRMVVFNQDWNLRPILAVRWHP